MCCWAGDWRFDSTFQTTVLSATSDWVPCVYAAFSCWMDQMTVGYFHQLAAASVKLLDGLNRCKTLFRGDVFIPVTIYFSLSLCCCGSFSRLKYCSLATTLSSASLWTQSLHSSPIPHTRLLSAPLLSSSSTSLEAALSSFDREQSCINLLLVRFKYTQTPLIFCIYGPSSLWFAHFASFCVFSKMIEPVKHEHAPSCRFPTDGTDRTSCLWARMIFPNQRLHQFTS